MTDELKTIDELMHGKQPGEVYIYQPGWGCREYIVPYFRDKHDKWHCLCDESDSFSFRGDVVTWKIWTPPKKKVTRWLWAYNFYNAWKIDKEYMTEAEAKRQFKDPKRLDFSATEFEE